MQPHPTQNTHRSPGNPSQEEGRLCSRQPRRRSRMAWQGGHHQPQPCRQGGEGSCLTWDPITQQGQWAAMPAAITLRSQAAPGSCRQWLWAAAAGPSRLFTSPAYEAQALGSASLTGPSQRLRTAAPTSHPSLRTLLTDMAPERQACALALVVTAKAMP